MHALTPKIAVIIATKGRAETVRRLATVLGSQTISPDSIIISAVDQADVDGVAELHPAIRVVLGPPGGCCQRNAGLAQVPAGTDVIVFFDDDFVPSRFWLENVWGVFRNWNDVVAACGLVLADGISGPGISWEAGAEIVAQYDSAAHSSGRAELPPRDAIKLYGCNMAFRAGAVRGITFDERLVLYSWHEDTDFGARVASRGRVIWTEAVWGVHLGIKRGRVPGVKLGYSQIVNPWYLVSKGTMRPGLALKFMSRNFIANLVRSLRPEPYIDRAGRLKGNLIGLVDIVSNRWRPERAAEL